MSEADRNPLVRWSRRKRGLEHPAELPAREADAPRPPFVADAPEAESPSVSPEAADIAEEGEETPIAEGSLDHTLPDPDTLGPGSDFKAYLVPGVSAALKRRALRRLYATGNYNVRDGLDDYDADYRQLRRLAPEASETVRRWGRRAVEKLEEKLDTASREAVQGDEACSSPEASGKEEVLQVSSPRHEGKNPSS